MNYYIVGFVVRTTAKRTNVRGFENATAAVAPPTPAEPAAAYACMCACIRGGYIII